MKVPTMSTILPAALLAFGLAAVASAPQADAASRATSTSVDATQAAVVFDAAFSNHKAGRPTTAGGVYVDKLWTNTQQHSFYGQ